MNLQDHIGHQRTKSDFWEKISFGGKSTKTGQIEVFIFSERAQNNHIEQQKKIERVFLFNFQRYTSSRTAPVAQSRVARLIFGGGV